MGQKLTVDPSVDPLGLASRNVPSLVIPMKGCALCSCYTFYCLETASNQHIAQISKVKTSISSPTSCLFLNLLKSGSFTIDWSLTIATACLGEIFPSAYRKFCSTKTASVREYNYVISDIDRNKTGIVNTGK